MPRPKRSSTILDKAQRRLASLKSIDSSLDLGNGLTVKSFAELIQDTRNKLESYNSALSVVGQTKNLVDDAERSLAELSELMLKGVACKYGMSSNEYEMAGGSKKKTRKRITRKATTPTAPETTGKA